LRHTLARDFSLHALITVSAVAVAAHYIYYNSGFVLAGICSGGQLSAADVTLPSGLEAAAAVLNIGGTPAAAAAAAGLGVPGGMPGAAAAAGVAVPEDATIAVPEELECPICLDSFEAPAMTPCHHWFCK
jgi:hypothetical protein